MPFKKGTSGNPNGRRPGSKNRATLFLQSLLDGEVEALSRKAVDLALAGHPALLKHCLQRLAPTPRGRTIDLGIGRLETLDDLTQAQFKVVEAMTTGRISPEEAAAISKVLDTTRAALLAKAEEDVIRQDQKNLVRHREEKLETERKRARAIEAMIFPDKARQQLL